MLLWTLEATLWMQKFWNSWFLVSHLDMFPVLESHFDASGWCWDTQRDDGDTIWQKGTSWLCIVHIYGQIVPPRYENLDALFKASASSPMRAIHRSINSLFSC